MSIISLWKLGQWAKKGPLHTGEHLFLQRQQTQPGPDTKPQAFICLGSITELAATGPLFLN